jgi:DNA-binding NarL/FixJ family response regulator
MGELKVTTVLIVDDHPLVAEYTRNEISQLRKGVTVLVAGTLEEAEAMIRRDGAPAFVLLDLVLPDCRGLLGLVRLRQLAPNSVIGVVTGETNPNVMRDCFAQGARGYLTKSTGAEDFTAALRKLLGNGFFYPPQAIDQLPRGKSTRLTRREMEVLQVLSIGRANKQLATLLGISESTFKTYLRSIYDKLEVGTRVSAVRRGVELGLIDTRRRA